MRIAFLIIVTTYSCENENMGSVHCTAVSFKCFGHILDTIGIIFPSTDAFILHLNEIWVQNIVFLCEDSLFSVSPICI